MDQITIKKISNGFISNTEWSTKNNTIYHSNMADVIKYLDSVWGNIDRELEKIREKK